MGPVIFVEDEWLGQRVRAELEELIGPVRPAFDFGALKAEVDSLAQDASAGPPVIVLDPGVPGVCRLEAVRRTRELHAGAVIVVWTATRDPSFLATSLLDGAMAAVSKNRPLSALATSVGRASSGRYGCDPEQAQWFLDFLSYLNDYRANLRQGRGGHVWTDTKVTGRQATPEWSQRLEEVATGEPLSADDRWFAELVEFVRSYWLQPYLRQTLTALAIHGSRSQAAEALGKGPRTFDGYCSKLSTLLMPGRYLGDRRKETGLALAAWVLKNHAGCELATEDHELSGPGLETPLSRVPSG